VLLAHDERKKNLKHVVLAARGELNSSDDVCRLSDHGTTPELIIAS